MTKNIIIYRDHLLPASETFIKAQASTLTYYNPFFAGSKYIGGLELPLDRVIVINSQNTLRESLGDKFFKFALRPPGSFLRRLKEVSPLLIHAHFALDAIFALPIAKRLDVPLIVTLHGYDITMTNEHWTKSPSYVGRSFPKRRQRLFESDRVHFIAVSEHIKRKAVEKGVPEERIEVHYIGVDTDAFIPVANIPKKTTVLFVGRLIEKKGCTYLIQAMSRVQKVLPTAELVIIGDGPLRTELEKEADRLCVKCYFAGMQSNEAVRDHMRKSRVICVPSVTCSTGDTEGLPIVVYEAMAMGIPVASTYSAGIPEAVINGETGLLSPEADARCLAENLLRLVQDDDAWLVMSHKSRSMCEQKFALASQTKTLEAFYSKILKR